MLDVSTLWLGAAYFLYHKLCFVLVLLLCLVSAMLRFLLWHHVVTMWCYSFPTIYFAPKGSKDSPKSYEVSVQLDQTLESQISLQDQLDTRHNSNVLDLARHED